MFSFRARAEKGIVRHIGASSVVGTSNFLLVRSEHAHASYPGLFFRPPGFRPYMGREERKSSGTGLRFARKISKIFVTGGPPTPHPPPPARTPMIRLTMKNLIGRELSINLHYYTSDSL